MDEANWTYESTPTILKASPELRERFRVATRARFQEDGVENPPREEVEEMAAFAWRIRAEEVCAKADVLIEEGVSNEEVRNILRIQPE